MDHIVRRFARLADVHDCAIELSHHVRKLAQGSAEYTAEDLRGASAIRDAVRALRILNLMSKPDADAAGLDEFERLTRFRIDRGKGNNSAPARSATWRQFVSVRLPNGDDVGVVVPWDFPGAGGAPSDEKTAADRQAEEIVMRLLDKFAARGSQVSEARAPTAFFEEPEARDAKLSKAALKAAIGRLLDAKRISIERAGRSDRGTRYLIPARSYIVA
jgi:hypothetical protein